MARERDSIIHYDARRERRDSERESHRERDAERESHRERDSERESHRERDSKREDKVSRRERERVREGDSERELSRDRRPSSRPRRDRSPSVEHHHRNQHRSPADRRANDEEMNLMGSNHQNEDDDSVAKMKAAEEALESKDKQKPSFELSGKLAAETNRVRAGIAHVYPLKKRLLVACFPESVTLLFNEPPDARKPEVRWRLYVFKNDEVLNEPLYVHRQSCYLFGRERRVADVPTDHPSCSKQHAVLQYRQVEVEKADGTLTKTVRPYVMDLGSTNGTFINGNRIEPERYYELLEKDTLKFGNSSREYVILHENSTSTA